MIVNAEPAQAQCGLLRSFQCPEHMLTAREEESGYIVQRIAGVGVRRRRPPGVAVDAGLRMTPLSSSYSASAASTTPANRDPIGDDAERKKQFVGGDVPEGRGRIVAQDGVPAAYIGRITGGRSGGKGIQRLSLGYSSKPYYSRWKTRRRIDLNACSRNFVAAGASEPHKRPQVVYSRR